MYSKIVAVGRSGKDGELAYIDSGTPVLRFSLAVDVGYGNSKATEWYNCSYFGKAAEAVAKYVTKGKLLLIEGEPKLNKYTREDGKTYADINVNVQNLKLLSKNEGTGTDTGNQTDNGTFADVIPF